MCAVHSQSEAGQPDDDWPRVPSKHGARKHLARSTKPPLEVFTTTLWEYPSQHYVSSRGIPEQGDRDYVGATPSWVIWQCLQRYTKEGDLVVDPMCGSGTTIDVALDLKRRVKGFDLSPPPPDRSEFDRRDIIQADARTLPLKDAEADFVFIDPPYSTHVEYSDDPRDIGKLDAAPDSPDQGRKYYKAMGEVIAEIDRILKPGKHMALYVSDSWKQKGTRHEARGTSERLPKRDNPPSAQCLVPSTSFSPIGFELFSILRRHFTSVDIIAVVRHNAKLQKPDWHTAAREGNYFLRGFNYLFIMNKTK